MRQMSDSTARLTYRRYLSLLGAKTKQSLENDIVSRLNNVLRETESTLPVHLSRVTEQFLIDPVPTRAVGPTGGSLKFHCDRKKFVITLYGLNADSYDDIGPRSRLRFNYAHEVAHRFFFIEHNDEWVRAIHEAITSLKGPERIRALTNLTQHEEAICNNIARRVLIPDDFLLNTIAPELMSELWAIRKQFFDVLGKFAKLLVVSRECLLLRLRNAIAKDMIKAPPQCALFVVEHSGARDKARRTNGELHLRMPLLPSELLNQSLKPAFPGMNLTAFGRPADEIVRDLVFSTSAAGAVKLPMHFAFKRATDEGGLTMNFRGWWHKLPSAKNRHTKLLFWGLLQNPAPQPWLSQPLKTTNIP